MDTQSQGTKMSQAELEMLRQANQERIRTSLERAKALQAEFAVRKADKKK